MRTDTNRNRMRIITKMSRNETEVRNLVGFVFPILLLLVLNNASRVANGFSVRHHAPPPLLSPPRTWLLQHRQRLSPHHLQSMLTLLSSSSLSSSSCRRNQRGQQRLYVSKITSSGGTDHNNTMMDDDDDDDETTLQQLNEEDEKLLRETSKSQLVDLCQQFSIDIQGTKRDLLLRLRHHAKQAAEFERQRRKDLRRRVERGGTGSSSSSDGSSEAEDDDDREKYELVDDHDDFDFDYDDEDDDDSDDDDFYIFVESKDPKLDEYQRELQELSDDGPESRAGTKRDDDHSTSSDKSGSRPITRATLTAPPPPDIEPNENGERVVTVYSTTDHNDLTGIAAAQPGNSFTADPMAGQMDGPKDAPWNIGPSSSSSSMGSSGDNDGVNPNMKTASTSEREDAKEELVELVQSLLALTGAPGFQNDFDDYDDDVEDGMNSDDKDQMYESMGLIRKPKQIRNAGRNGFATPEGFVGFDPTTVPADMLTKNSASLRMGRGKILQEVIREFEIRAIGYDGSAGDNKDRGGGHYRQVSLVRTFLEGFRRAEEGRTARETATMLLNKLVTDGIEGLDSMLSTMTRADDEATQEVGELNDALLDYLNDAIRKQEKKVSQIVNSMKKMEQLENAASMPSEDEIEDLWSKDEGEGSAVETFDPKDPKSKKALQDEYNKAIEQQEHATRSVALPRSAPEKILLLLKLLRDRIKVEAAFSNDEKSHNLRVLAYCLKLPNDQLRRELILKEFGTSLDRLDSFAELVSSSIEYGESTSTQLQPTKAGSMLNLPLLKRILQITNDVNKKQTWDSSGGRPSSPMP